MFWVIKSIIITIVLVIVASTLFGTPHIEIGNSFFLANCMISIIIMFTCHLIFKYCMPHSYAKYTAWYYQVSIYVRRITILPLIGYFVFVTYFFSYINQHNVISPIETITTKVFNKRIVYSRSSASHRIDIYISPKKTLEISDDDLLYEMLNIGDIVTVKIQKGRLNYFFALELKVQKNNYTISL